MCDAAGGGSVGCVREPVRRGARGLSPTAPDGRGGGRSSRDQRAAFSPAVRAVRRGRRCRTARPSRRAAVAAALIAIGGGAHARAVSRALCRFHGEAFPRGAGPHARLSAVLHGDAAGAAGGRAGGAASARSAPQAPQEGCGGRCRGCCCSRTGRRIAGCRTPRGSRI
jgi:hypothetical protein